MASSHYETVPCNICQNKEYTIIYPALPIENEDPVTRFKSKLSESLIKSALRFGSRSILKTVRFANRVTTLLSPQRCRANGAPLP